MTNDPGDGDLFSIREGITGPPEVFRLEVDLDLGGLAGDLGGKDDPANQLRIERPLDELGRQQRSPVWMASATKPRVNIKPVVTRRGKGSMPGRDSSSPNGNVLWISGGTGVMMVATKLPRSV